MRRLQREALESKLNESGVLSRVCDMVMGGVEALRGGGGAGAGVQDGAVANDKFQTNAKFQMSYGSLSLFYGGLESYSRAAARPPSNYSPAALPC